VSIEKRRQEKFVKIIDSNLETTNDSINRISERLYDLRGLVISGGLSSERWKNYILATDIEVRNPGKNNYIYADRVNRASLHDYLVNLKKTEKGEQYQKFSVFPPNNNSEFLATKYISTTDPDLSIMLGFDMMDSPKQLVAINEAVRKNAPTMSELLKMDVLIPGNKKTGYVILLPVYNAPAIFEYPEEERNKYFIGMVASWVSPVDILVGIGGLPFMESKGLHLIVYDGDTLQFDSKTAAHADDEIEIVRQVKVLNKTFKFVFHSTKDQILPTLEENLPLYTLIGLIILNLLWFFSVYAILTSRGKAEKLAKEATKNLEKFKEAVDGVSDHVIITDSEGYITYANKAAEKVTGYAFEEMKGQRPSLWGKQMPAEFYQKFWQTIKEEKKPYWGDITNKRKNGVLYEAEIHVSPILNEKGELLFFVGIERDMSKIRAVERMKTEFISLASHQLRTPLSAVKWFTEMLLHGDAGKLSKTQSEYVEKIDQSNQREIQLVNALLNVSRIESGRIIVDPKPTDLNDLISTVVVDIKILMDKHNKKLNWSVDEDIPKIVLDGDLIKHVYANLLQNASRYSNDGGLVTLKVYKNGDYVVSEVQDSGIGIPFSEQNRVFEKFFRASNALKKETEGSGLGLYLSKTIVESSGGKIGFVSEEGKGTKFWFTLPLGGMKKKEGDAKIT